MREPGVLRERGFDALAVGVIGSLCLVVLGVGAVALWAEYLNRWETYFVMEQAVAAATPVTAALAVAALLVGLGAVVRA